MTNNRELQLDENNIQQCFAAYIVYSCHQYCSALLNLVQAQYCSLLITMINAGSKRLMLNPAGSILAVYRRLRFIFSDTS